MFGGSRDVIASSSTKPRGVWVYMEGMDDYTIAGLPQPSSSTGFTRAEVEALLKARHVRVPRDTQFRRLDDEVCGRSRRADDECDSGLGHRRWDAHQFLVFEAGCRLLSAGFARSSIQQAVAGEISWDALIAEREERLRFLLSSDRDIELLRSIVPDELIAA